MTRYWDGPMRRAADDPLMAGNLIDTRPAYPSMRWLDTLVHALGEHGTLRRNTHCFDGLPIGSLLAAELVHPNADGNLVRTGAGLGEVLTYSFVVHDNPGCAAYNRSGVPVGLVSPDMEKGAPASRQTTFSYERLLPGAHERLVGLPALEAAGLIAVVSYADAFRRVGEYDRHAEGLALAGVADMPVHQVTAFGHGVVYAAPRDERRAP